jgi:hypothetical protein
MIDKEVCTVIYDDDPPKGGADLKVTRAPKSLGRMRSWTTTQDIKPDSKPDRRPRVVVHNHVYDTAEPPAPKKSAKQEFAGLEQEGSAEDEGTHADPGAVSGIVVNESDTPEEKAFKYGALDFHAGKNGNRYDGGTGEGRAWLKGHQHASGGYDSDAGYDTDEDTEAEKEERARAGILDRAHDNHCASLREINAKNRSRYGTSKPAQPTHDDKPAQVDNLRDLNRAMRAHYGRPWSR